MEPYLKAGGKYNFYKFRDAYSRDSWLFAAAFRPHPDCRIYAEVDFDLGNASSNNANRKSYTNLKFGAEYSPPLTTSGVNRWNFSNLPNFANVKPFAAIHANLYEEYDFSGNLCIQIGIQNRGSNNQLFRFGLQYFYGVSEQFQFAKRYPTENKFGFGVWYDY